MRIQWLTLIQIRTKHQNPKPQRNRKVWRNISTFFRYITCISEILLRLRFILAIVFAEIGVLIKIYSRVLRQSPPFSSGNNIFPRERRRDTRRRILQIFILKIHIARGIGLSSSGAGVGASFAVAIKNVGERLSDAPFCAGRFVILRCCLWHFLAREGGRFNFVS